MCKITCDICQDLMPLVRDGVASEDSRRAVEDHVAQCPQCGALWGQALPPAPAMDENRVLGRIKKQLATGAFCLMLVGILLGVSFSESATMFYNILLLPAVGALGYVALGKRAWSVPLGVFGLVYLWHLVKYLGQGMGGGFWALLAAPLFWGVIYSGLCTLGVSIGALLHIAFGKKGD